MSPRTIPMGGPLICEPETYGHCVFTREEVPGAIPNGTMVRKCDSEPGDSTPYGTIGEVIGSIPTEPLSDDELARLDRRFRDAEIAYFIQWSHRPNEVIGIIDKKIQEVT